MTVSLERTVQVKDTTLHCRTDGPEGAPWVIFSHSILTNLSLWDEQAAALSGEFRTLRYDQRGHGDSAISSEPCTLDILAGDVSAILDAFGIARATLVGISMGAAIAFRAAQIDSRITRIMPCDGRATAAPSNAKAWEERIAVARAKGMDAFAEMTIARWFPPGSSGTPERIDRVRAMIRATPVEGFAAAAGALQSYDCSAGLATTRIPALLVAGGADGDAPRTMRELQGRIAGARFIEIPGAGHLPNIAAPKEFNSLLLDFLQDYG